jgi:hypothetical protein
MGSIPECSSATEDNASKVVGDGRKLPGKLLGNSWTSAWPLCTDHTSSNVRSLDQFAAELRAADIHGCQVPVAAIASVAKVPAAPQVYIQDTWSTHGTQLWTQFTGWNTDKRYVDSLTSVTAIVESGSSDESSSGEQLSSTNNINNNKRRHSHVSSQQSTSALNGWNLTLPGQGSKLEGHRPLFMQHSDPLAQRPFDCWPTAGGAAIVVSSPPDGAAGSVDPVQTQSSAAHHSY